MFFVLSGHIETLAWEKTEKPFFINMGPSNNIHISAVLIFTGIKQASILGIYRVSN